MTEKNYLTIHSLTALPWHNLNRDDRGLPKQVREGGKTRGRLSSQSLKRAIRVAYELDSFTDGTNSLRSRDLHKEIVRRAAAIATTSGTEFDEAAALKIATKIVKSLTANDKDAAETDGPAKEASSDTMTWLSGDEIDALAGVLARGEGGAIKAADHIKSRTGSLSIAAFGRMFAAQSDVQTEAGIAVGPATTTHPIMIEVDYFTTVDDLGDGGAGHLGQAFYTSGVYYRSVTIDKKQLRDSWTGWDSPDAPDRLGLLVRSIVTALPSGKDNSTAPNTRPALIIAETQAHRTAYEFHEPVKADADGGYLKGSIARLIGQAAQARAFDPREFGESIVSGTSVNTDLVIGFEHTAANLPELTERIVEWLQR
ncbi:type I-E CRISPR-associated protein Cas7/Cse4/CasC [Cryobacterium frigoriphilum]|uniref:Type I-E CRISPR-associated protein Cas7/Cse4/CasC n=1 Tax=Cryobacterium frigoriphilum TaxID=1259150 RepID=A0A4R8ZU26_9MICO|nr:type I-E CRISPR-associated protein Cas7/Cse4/CasC [Cryobacterium frigoriphilum]TFD45938.1 type I-E CRISPR-associated protein Cas7/Cse4/CasC [Cryobacterium frigoriphilum]